MRISGRNTSSGATGRDSMHTESQRKEPSTTGPQLRPANRRKLPDPPDPDNLPIDYRSSGWDTAWYPSSAPESLRPHHSSRQRSS